MHETLFRTFFEAETLRTFFEAETLFRTSFEAPEPKESRSPLIAELDARCTNLLLRTARGCAAAAAD